MQKIIIIPENPFDPTRIPNPEFLKNSLFFVNRISSRKSHFETMPSFRPECLFETEAKYGMQSYLGQTVQYGPERSRRVASISRLVWVAKIIHDLRRGYDSK